ncbi:NUDIX domain-containing protein [Glycomyces terrestris]|uniref:NUDIX hydrolase n=1 Tax=Glycomyces terrestris TaxID=2493553 RepID=A0A426UYX0_9ACTN|nr:NUDIX domain-containing protein [Glycomyces terrestris]RRR99760.1 hypothetical protein EIW28_13880 [Glycomyces terrestris]
MIPEGDYRTSARILVLAPDDTVLHVGGNRCREGVERWFTPGGGVEDGEDLAAEPVDLGGSYGPWFVA